MWTLLKAARKAYKAWRSMDRQEREAVAAHAHRVRALAVELGGPAAARFVEGSGDINRATDAMPASRRPRGTVVADLRDAIEALSRACARPGAQIVRDATPRSARIGARIAGAGARHLAPRIRTAGSPFDTPAIPTAPAGWYPDPTGRYEHRYWDGRSWTCHVTSDGAPTTDSAVAPLDDAHERSDDVAAAVEDRRANGLGV